MNARDYLLQVKKYEAIIKNKQIEIDRWRELAKGSSAWAEGERVQSSGNPQRMADAVCTYVDMEEVCVKETNDLKMQIHSILKTIQKLKLQEYTVLHMVYFQYMEYVDVARETKNSESWVKSTHGNALVSLQAILDEGRGNDKGK